MPDLDFFVLGEGPVVLLLHGWGQNKEMMLSLAERLKYKYKCVVIDMPGFGNSKFNNEKNMEDYVVRIHEFLTQNLKLHPKYIVGHSFGGKVAFQYYLKYGYIKGIVLIASPVLKPKRNLSYYVKIFAYKLMKKFKIKNKMGSDDYRNTNHKMRSFFVNVVNTHYDKILNKIRIPLLLIYSKEDEKVEFSRAKRLKRKLNKSRLKVIKGDHFAYLTNENVVSLEINNFIKEIENKRELYL